LKIYHNNIKFIRFELINSTNTYLKENINLLDENKIIVIVSDKQTEGKGQKNNKWFSNDENGVYFSLGIKLNINKNFQYLPHLTAVSIIDCLNDITNSSEFKIKEPNDILFNNKKISGILIENVVKGDFIYIIIGIGLNVNNDVNKFPKDIKDIAISLKEIFKREFDKDEIIKCLSDKLIKNIDLLLSNEELILRKYREKLI